MKNPCRYKNKLHNRIINNQDGVLIQGDNDIGRSLVKPSLNCEYNPFSSDPWQLPYPSIQVTLGKCHNVQINIGKEWGGSSESTSGYVSVIPGGPGDSQHA